MSEKFTQEEPNEGWWRRTKRTAVRMGKAAVIGMLPVAMIPFPEAREEYRPPSISILHDEYEDDCPPESQFAIMNVAGLGMTTTSEYAGRITKEIVGTQYDACHVALDYGTSYGISKNAEALGNFLQENKFDSVVVFAQSFGGIASVDMIDAYKHQYPNSKTKFMIVFISSPGGPESLQLGSWLGAQLHAAIPFKQEMVWLETYGLTLLQGGVNPFDGETLTNTTNNADETPSTLLYEQSNRMLKGMNKFSSEAAEGDVEFAFAADREDGVIKADQSVRDIERRLGRTIKNIEYLDYTNKKLNNHATLWWQSDMEIHRKVVLGSIAAAQKEFGFNAKQPVADTDKTLASSDANRPV